MPLEIFEEGRVVSLKNSFSMRSQKAPLWVNPHRLRHEPSKFVEPFDLCTCLTFLRPSIVTIEEVKKFNKISHKSEYFTHLPSNLWRTDFKPDMGCLLKVNWTKLGTPQDYDKLLTIKADSRVGISSIVHRNMPTIQTEYD